MIDDPEIKVSEGGLKIVDFDDLKIAFMDLHNKHQQLATAFNNLRRQTRNDISYGPIK